MTELGTLTRRLVEIDALRVGEFTFKAGIRSPFHAVLTISQCFDEWERSGLADVLLLRQSREFLKATRFA